MLRGWAHEVKDENAAPQSLAEAARQYRENARKREAEVAAREGLCASTRRLCRRYAQLAMACENNPLNIVLFQELDRYNALLVMIKARLRDLQRGAEAEDGAPGRLHQVADERSV